MCKSIKTRRQLNYHKCSLCSDVKIYIFTLLFKIPSRWYRQCQHWFIVFPYFKSHQGQSVSDWWVLMALLSKSHRFCCQNHTEYPIIGKEYHPQNWNSHGGLRDFGSQLIKNNPLQNWNFSWRTSVLSLLRISPPLELELLMEDFAGDWRIIAVSPVPFLQ